MKRIIGVIGGGQCSPDIEKLAEEVGAEIAKHNALLICGGLGGVMQAACRGAKQENGTTIGVLPGSSKADANSFVDIPIVTGISEARNIIIVRSSDAVIAIDGRYGTLSEISFCLIFGVPVVGLQTWDLDASIIKAGDSSDAVAKAFAAIEKSK